LRHDAVLAAAQHAEVQAFQPAQALVRVAESPRHEQGSELFNRAVKRGEKDQRRPAAAVADRVEEVVVHVDGEVAAVHGDGVHHLEEHGVAVGGHEVEAVELTLAGRPRQVDAGRTRRIVELETDSDLISPGVGANCLGGFVGGEGVVEDAAIEERPIGKGGGHCRRPASRGGGGGKRPVFKLGWRVVGLLFKNDLLFGLRSYFSLGPRLPSSTQSMEAAAMEDRTTQQAAAPEEERPSTALGLKSLGEYTVGTIPTLFYVPGFISQDEQSQLLHHIYQAPAPKWKSLKNRRLQNWGGVVHEKGLLPQALPPWLTKITDRICQWTGLFPSAINHVLINEYHPNQGIMPHQDGPAYYPVVAIISLASPVVIDFTPHQRLKGQEHTDPQHSELQTPAESESNGLHELEGAPESDLTSSLLLMPCSLLIFKDQAYTDYLHGIQDSDLHNLDKVANMSQCPELAHLKSDCSQGIVDEKSGTFRRTATRVSLTCRLVLKVHKKLFKF
ncbi:hypothetical protein EJB05_22779, partial [Eragrostis curvula]